MSKVIEFKKSEVNEIALAENAGVISFDEAMKKNAETQERLRKERLAANKIVLKSYSIKK